MAKRAAKSVRKSRTIEEREAYHQRKLNELKVRKQIADLRATLSGKSSKKQ